MSKRKRVVLTFQQKLEILRQLNEGKNGTVLAKEYGIGSSTISDLRRNSETILQFVSNLECPDQISAKKTRKTAQNTDLDSKIFRWYNEEKNRGVSPPDAVVCAKALEINKELNGNENFKASAGWLRHFKNRHGIKDGKEQCEESSWIGIGKQLRNAVKRGGYTLENVYNADDGFLLWKSLPECDNKGSVTVIGCTNANGSHKLPLCVFGREKKHVDSSNIIYKPQNDTFFVEWFEEVFIPHVKQRQNATGNSGKILLVIDDAPWHPCRDTLVKNRPDVGIDIFYVPDTLETQPMELEINNLKTAYRTKLLNLLTQSDSITQFQQEFTLEESIPVIDEAWDSIPRAHIVESWGRLLLNGKNDGKFDPPEISEIVAIAQTIPGLEFYTYDQINQWLNCDKYFFYLNTTEDIQESGENETINDGPSNVEAYQSFDTVIQWFTRQEECNRDQLAVLESLRDLARSKVYRSVKQETE